MRMYARGAVLFSLGDAGAALFLRIIKVNARSLRVIRVQAEVVSRVALPEGPLEGEHDEPEEPITVTTYIVHSRVDVADPTVIRWNANLGAYMVDSLPGGPSRLHVYTRAIQPDGTFEFKYRT